MEKFLEGLNMCARGTKAHGPLLLSIHGAKLKVDLSGSPLCLVRILDEFGDLCGITNLLLLLSVPQFLATRLTWIKLVLLYIFSTMDVSTKHLVYQSVPTFFVLRKKKRYQSLMC